MEEILQNLRDNDPDVRRAAADELKFSSENEAIDALIGALSDINRGVAEASENALLYIRGQNVIQKVLPLLSSDKPELRNFAFEILSDIGSDSLDDITALLKDDDKDLRKFAADILGELADPMTTDALLQTLDDSDVNVAAAAAESLGKIKDKRAIPELIKRLEGDVWMQCSVIKSLSMFNDKIASEKVYELVPSLNGMSLFSAISALGEVGSGSAIPTLINLLNEENKALYGSIVSSLEKIINREGVDSVVSLTGGINVNELIELLKAPKIETIISTINVLGWLKNKAAIKPLIDKFIEAEQKPKYLNEDIKHHLFDAIINIDPSDISYIIHTLESPHVPHATKAELIDIIGKLQKREALSCILKLKDSESVMLRRVVAKTLGEFNNPDSISALKTLLKDIEGHARGSAATSLGKLCVESAIDDLIVLFVDIYSDVRELAALALAQIGSNSVINKLKEISLSPASEGKKRLALLALSKIGKPAAIDILVKHLKDSDPKMRKITIEAIAEHSVLKCSDELISMLDDEDNEVKIAAIAGLSKIKADNSIPYLMSKLEHDVPIKMRYQIVEALGNLKAIQATDMLIKLLEDESSVIVLSAIEALGKIQGEKALEPLKKFCNSDNKEIARTAKGAVDLIDRGF